MNRYLTIICIIGAVLLGVGIFAYNFLEIYDKEVYKHPSAEARSNDFLALQRWLSETGHPVHTWEYGYPEDILESEDSVVVLDALSFYWEEDTFDILGPWIEAGNHLVIYYDYWQDDYSDKDFYSFIEQFGVTMITPGTSEKPPNSPEAETPVPEAPKETIDKTDSFVQISDEQPSEKDPDLHPTMDRSIEFTLQKNRRNIRTAGNDNETINLVQIPLGEGTVTFTGRPYFMRNINLKKTGNRMLSWQLTGAGDIEKQGILFIRETEFKNTFFQDLVNAGNIFPLLISIFILTVVCFWGFIPRFGKIIADEETPGKPIRERFLAEALFLKKFRSLNVYLDNYEKTIQQRFRKNYGEYIHDKNAFCSRLAEIVKLDAIVIENALYPKGLITSRSFTNHMKTIEIIMERL